MSMSSMRPGYASDVELTTRIQGRQATRQQQGTSVGQTTFRPIPPHAQYDMSYQPTSHRNSKNSNGHEKSSNRSKHAPRRNENPPSSKNALRSDEKYEYTNSSEAQNPKTRVSKQKLPDHVANHTRLSGGTNKRNGDVSDGGQRNSNEINVERLTEKVTSADCDVKSSRLTQEKKSEGDAPERPPLPKDFSNDGVVKDRPRELPPYRHPPPAPQRVLQAAKIHGTDGRPKADSRHADESQKNVRTPSMKRESNIRNSMEIKQVPDTPNQRLSAGAPGSRQAGTPGSRWGGSRKSIDHNSNQIAPDSNTAEQIDQSQGHDTLSSERIHAPPEQPYTPKGMCH